MTPEERAELRRMEKEATPGPWSESWSSGPCIQISPFIAAMRKAIIPLLDALEKAEKERDDFKTLLLDAEERVDYLTIRLDESDAERDRLRKAGEERKGDGE